MGLNLTSTKPSASETSFRAHHGNVPWADCFSTFGLLGAVLSAPTVHLGVPRPVTPQVQPAGAVPTDSWSKPIVSANAEIVIRDPASPTKVRFIHAYSSMLGLRVQGRLEPLSEAVNRANAPIVQEHVARRLANHVVVNRHDVDVRGTQGLEHSLHFAFEHGEVTIDDRKLLAPRERGPGIDPHL